ncbi:MAG: XdhC family protein [Porticoccaceae bacterium]
MVSNSHYGLLKTYFDSLNATRDDGDWVLAIVLDKTGSSYRRPGAFMLISPLGQCFGLVSGGCLEADIVLRARQALESRKPCYVIYDMAEDDSYAAELGIGCGGKIGVLVQPLGQQQQLFYRQLFQRLSDGESCYLGYGIPPLGVQSHGVAMSLIAEDGTELARLGGSLCRLEAVRQVKIPAPVSLWVFGGGADARPLVAIAAQLGWRVSVVDHRPAYARVAGFPLAEQIFRARPDNSDALSLANANAAVLMTHNLAMDAAWLKCLSGTEVRYVALLGPRARRLQVEALAGVEDANWLATRLHGPAGLALGGELPESIALSILAECHAHLHRRRAESLNLAEVINP